MPDPKTTPAMRPRAPSHTEHDSIPRPPLVRRASLLSLAPASVTEGSFIYQVAQATEANTEAIAELRGEMRRIHEKNAEQDRALAASDVFQGEVLKKIAGLTTDVETVRSDVEAVRTKVDAVHAKLDGIRTSSAGAKDAALDAAVATKKLEATGATKRSQLIAMFAVPIFLAILQAGREAACKPPPKETPSHEVR